MKIFLLGPLNSVHFQRWICALYDLGHEVVVGTQHPSEGWVVPIGVKLYRLPMKGLMGYFSNAIILRKIIRRELPDILNVHYASGYGTTAFLVGFKPYILSVWGSDVYDFPTKSVIHKKLVQKNLKAASKVASTSHCMAAQTRLLLPRLNDIAITPFGVDLAAYAGIKPEPAEQKSKFIIGTVKTMSQKYGIDTLIEAFALLQKSLQCKKGSAAPDIELRLVGGGEQNPELHALAVRLGIADKVNFVGRVPHTQVPQELAKLDIYVALSRLDSESFGVAIIEAGAAGRPVVVSDAGGLPEVTVDGVTGFVVPRENPAAAAAAMERLVLDAKLRNQMGQAGQVHVAQHYSWDACVITMLSVYQETIQRHSLQQT